MTVASISEAIEVIRKHLQAAPEQRVQGEIIQVDVSAKGFWITLADQTATAQLFLPKALAADPALGQHVEVRAKVRQKRDGSWYFLAGGRLHLLEEIGPLAAERTAAVASLEEQGLLTPKAVSEFQFAEPHKVQWPELSKVIVLTSEHSDGVADFRKKLKKVRDPGLIEYRHIRMQGDGLVVDLAYELGRIDPTEADLVFIVRGGGGWEQLRAFDDAQTAKAIAISKVPVATAVGHETDRSLADAAAKWAFITPTEAGEALERALYLQSDRAKAAKRAQGQAAGRGSGTSWWSGERDRLREEALAAQVEISTWRTRHTGAVRELQQAQANYSAVWRLTDEILRDGARQRVKHRAHWLTLLGVLGILLSGSMVANGVVQLGTAAVLAALSFTVLAWFGPKRAEQQAGKRAMKKAPVTSTEWVERCRKAKTPRELRVLLTHRPTS